MASVIDLSSLTLNPEEATEVSQAVFEQVYVKGMLGDLHFVQTGVEMDRYIPIFGLIPMLGKLSSGCTPNAASGLAASQKQWTPKLLDFRLSHCQGDVDQLFKLWKRSRMALNTWEEVDNEEMAFIMDRAKDAMQEMILRVTSFGDTGALNVSGGGQITNGVSTTFFTMLNGLWKQIFTGVAAGDIVRYEITENGGATKTAQLDLGDTRALTVLRYLHDNIDPRAFESGTLKYQITRGLWNNWRALLEDKSLANAVLDNVNGENKSTISNYRGIPIVVRHDWDRQIQTNHDLGTTYYLPNRAVLAPIENIPVGTSDEESFNELDSFYDKTDKTHYIDGAAKLDVKILEEHNIAVAY